MAMVAAIKNILPSIRLDVERWRFNEEAQLYVSNQGRVKRKDGTLMQFKIRRDNGYITICTRETGFFSVHQLVARTWIPNDDPEHKTTIDHLDHNKRNNRVENLEWVSRKENRERADNDAVHGTAEADRLIEKYKEQNKNLKKQVKGLQKTNLKLTQELENRTPLKVIPMNISAPSEVPYIYVNGNALSQHDFELMLMGCAQGNEKTFKQMKEKVRLFLESGRVKLSIGGMNLRRLNTI